MPAVPSAAGVTSRQQHFHHFPLNKPNRTEKVSLFEGVPKKREKSVVHFSQDALESWNYISELWESLGNNRVLEAPLCAFPTGAALARK